MIDMKAAIIIIALLLTALMLAAIWAFTGTDDYDEQGRNDDA